MSRNLHLSRRSFLRTSSMAAAAVGATRFGSTAVLASPPGDDTVLSGTNSSSDMTVAPGKRLIFDPNKSTTLELTGNLVVEGTLEMRPARPDVVHTIRFVGVNESSFVGGGMSVLPTDVGLWVMGAGRLDIQGTPKAAWNRTGSDTTWTSADELIVTPTALDDWTGFATHKLGDAPPAVNGHTAEVLNLTRNVVIEGTPSGRTHVFIHSASPQTLRHAVVRHVGPRNASGAVLGRYGLHFHHSGDGSRASLVEGVIVRDCGGHAFAPHLSNGITFADCIAYNVNEDAFWWDDGDVSHDIVWDRCVAAKVVALETTEKPHTLSGFVLGTGDGNVCRNSVGVGIDGGVTSAGFNWPSGGPFGVWLFEDCIAHNNRQLGIYAWQNDNRSPHVISRYSSYRNRKAGIEHGAYTNHYVYKDSTSYQDGLLKGGLRLHAVSSPKGTKKLVFEKMTWDGGGKSPAAVHVVAHTLPTTKSTEFVSCTMKGHTNAPVVIENRGKTPGLYDFVRCGVGSTGRDMKATDFVIEAAPAGTLIRVQPKVGKAFEINSKGVVKTIANFA